MISVLISLLGAMPLPPPGQIVKGFGSIPESRNGPIFSWHKERIPALEWSCRVTLPEGGGFKFTGRAEAIDVEPSDGAAPRWPPFGIVKVAPDSGHRYDGSFIATYSRKIYGFRFARDGSAYEATLRFDSYEKPGVIEFRRWRPVADEDWKEIGRGTCSAQQKADEGAMK